MSKKIVRFPSQILSQISVDVENFDDLKSTVDEMFETLKSSGGVGLAATQIGILKRIIVIDDSSGSDLNSRKYMINSVILEKNGKFLSKESCLSVPGVALEINRSENISVEHTLLDSTKTVEKFFAYIAAIIQHEIDHLDGKTILDRVSKEKRREAFSKMSRAIK